MTSRCRSPFQRKTLIQRLTVRWTNYGLLTDGVEAKVYGNDLPNARMVMLNSVDPDYVLLD
jgi:hypothetical protein